MELTSSHESARQAVPAVWKQILLITDKTPVHGFKPSAARLIIAEIAEDYDGITFASAPFGTEKRERIEQIQNAMRNTANGITIPVGVVFVAEYGTNEGLDEVVPLPDAVEALAQISNRSVDDVVGILSAEGASIASVLLSAIMRGKVRQDGPLS
jgi:hypothetical protein